MYQFIKNIKRKCSDNSCTTGTREEKKEIYKPLVRGNESIQLGSLIFPGANKQQLGDNSVSISFNIKDVLKRLEIEDAHLWGTQLELGLSSLLYSTPHRCFIVNYVRWWLFS